MILFIIKCIQKIVNARNEEEHTQEINDDEIRRPHSDFDEFYDKVYHAYIS